MSATEPHKELRFTRSAQAVPFWIAAAMLVAAAFTLLVVSCYRGNHPELPHPAWSILPLVLAWICSRIALRCTKHAYLILTPLGLEIFPFFRPQTEMDLLYWTQIADADFADDRITLHFTEEKTSGIHLSLAPIAKSHRPLLEHALRGRLKNNRQSSSDTPQS